MTTALRQSAVLIQRHAREEAPVDRGGLRLHGLGDLGGFRGGLGDEHRDRREHRSQR